MSRQQHGRRDQQQPGDHEAGSVRLISSGAGWAPPVRSECRLSGILARMRRRMGCLCVVVLAGGVGIMVSGCGSSTSVPHKDAGTAPDLPISSGGVGGSSGSTLIGGSGGSIPGGAGGSAGAGGNTTSGTGGRNTGGTGTTISGTGGQGGTGGLAGTGGRSGTGGSTGKGGTGAGGTTGKGGTSGLGGTGTAGSGGSTPDGGGSPPDAGIDSSKDVSTSPDGSLPECLGLPGGTCTTMVNGCASCPAGFYANPTRAGCDEQYEWCCTKVAPPTNDCTDGGGVCVANGAGCPNKWTKMRTSCGTGSDAICCVTTPEDCPAFPQGCFDIGGVCTDVRWGTCPVGMEIYALGNDQLGCENNWYGWCCVDAPPSTCADGLNGTRGMCVPGECSGCFAPVISTGPGPALTCEVGRSCCRDMCD
jgi:hypothetical protein